MNAHFDAAHQLAIGASNHGRDIDHAGHSGFAPENFTTFAHFSTSSANHCPTFAGVIGIGTAPRSAKRFFSLLSARAASISPLSLWMISAGVFRGAPSANQAVTS